MSVHVVRLPDVGEGIAEAELVSWCVGIGDMVTPDTIIAEVLTDKATVEIYAPVAGTVTFLTGEPGDVLAVGGDFIGIETGDTVATTVGFAAPGTPATSHDQAPGAASPAAPPGAERPAALPGAPGPAAAPFGDGPRPATSPRGAPVTASPAVRDRARRLGIDLADVRPGGPGGRISHEDLDDHLIAARRSADGAAGRSLRPMPAPTAMPMPATDTAGPLIGVRRKIASRMTEALRIPHITYVDEVDMTQLEGLRRSLTGLHPDRPRLTVLSFLVRSIVLAVADHPQINATFDDQREPQVLTTHAAVNIGIATQTASGLIVPVVHDARSLDLWSSAAELVRVTAAAREGTAGRHELTGSTITITSLGALGGLVTTPIINRPEVAIVGVNKMQTRPVWDGSSFVPRTMMNLSSSFDHRIIDGHDAATFVQRIKTLLEEPSLLFLHPPTATA